jgi:hypothetical protein
MMPFIKADDFDDRGSGAVTKVELMQNNLSGNVPTGFCKISTLTHLLLDQNNIKGQLPDELGNLVNLKVESCWLVGGLVG